MALYRAKADGRSRYRFFEAEMDAQMQARRAIELDLREAMTRNELQVWYQPIFDLVENRVSGFEALLRWQHRELGHDPAGAVHSPGGGTGPDRADRRVGAAAGHARMPRAGRMG